MEQYDAGKVRLDEPITTYLPWAKLKPLSADSGPITVRGILSHSAGSAARVGLAVLVSARLRVPDAGADPGEDRRTNGAVPSRALLPVQQSRTDAGGRDRRGRCGRTLCQVRAGARDRSSGSERHADVLSHRLARQANGRGLQRPQARRHPRTAEAVRREGHHSGGGIHIDG